MEVNYLTNHVYTNWGKRYSSFNWTEEWKPFINNHSKSVNKILAWFDMNILQRIGKDTKFTTDVRIRIVCGMINKISYYTLSREMKLSFMECIWDIYKQFNSSFDEYHCRYILGLPF